MQGFQLDSWHEEMLFRTIAESVSALSDSFGSWNPFASRIQSGEAYLWSFLLATIIVLYAYVSYTQARHTCACFGRRIRVGEDCVQWKN